MGLHKSTNELRFRKCLDLAERAETQEGRQLWLSMARTWQKLSDSNAAQMRQRIGWGETKRSTH
jgi:hypothetical protein